MIGQQTQKTLQLFEVPCKNRLTRRIEYFEIVDYDYSHAIKELEYFLGLEWIVGFGSM